MLRARLIIVLACKTLRIQHARDFGGWTSWFSGLMNVISPLIHQHSNSPLLHITGYYNTFPGKPASFKATVGNRDPDKCNGSMGRGLAVKRMGAQNPLFQQFKGSMEMGPWQVGGECRNQNPIEREGAQKWLPDEPDTEPSEFSNCQRVDYQSFTVLQWKGLCRHQDDPLN